MELIFVLLPFALLFAGIALALFIWAARSGQFDDLSTPAVRILFDDELAGARPIAAGGAASTSTTERAQAASSTPDGRARRDMEEP